jgi:hypothetical protein
LADALDIADGEQLVASESAVKGNALCIAGIFLEPIAKRPLAGAQVRRGFFD